MAVKSKSNELRIIRVYDAPVKAVWDAWTVAERSAQWWGPRGFTLTTHGKDLRPGGSWSYTMHGPDGVDYPNKARYLEVETHSRLVYDHGGSDDRPPLFRVTVVFQEVRDKTRMEMIMTFPTPEAAEETRKFIKRAGGDSTWDKLAEYLAKESSGKDQFVINRSFDAPIDVLFRMWTDPRHIARWLPPTGLKMAFLRADIRPGGTALYYLTSESGARMHGRSRYLEIEPPSRIVYFQQFCDENERVVRPPHSPSWPETLLTTVTLEEEGPHRTRVTVMWEPHGKTTSEERETFVKARGSMTQGWTGTFDKLEAFVNESEGASESKLSGAFDLALRSHRGQSWKDTERSFLYHPLAVASLVLRFGGTEEQAVAALLHDAIESPVTSRSELEARFGEPVARMVSAFADPEGAGPGWRELKQAYLDKLGGLDEESLLVIACEELHDGGELLQDLRYRGVSVWKRYPVHAMEVFWYYRELLVIFTRRLAADRYRPLLGEFASVIRALKGIVFEGD